MPEPFMQSHTIRNMIRIITINCAALLMFSTFLMGDTPYDFGNPTSDEQLFIELINRARANPAAEGERLASTTDPILLGAYSSYNVDLVMMQNEFDVIAAQAPLVPNASLTNAARGHSEWMLANATQSHNQTNPANTSSERVTAAGYNFTAMGENVFAFCNLIPQGHASFQVDWGADGGGSTGGMQSLRGHRNTIHSGTYREIGVGVIAGTNGNVGPNVVTQDFGFRASATSFGTGVAYYDLNGNNFYDSGEGISGLTVNVEGTSNFCTTAIGGGWVVPVPSAAATRAVTFSGLGVNHVTNLIFPGSNNAKADLKLTYSSPTITSSDTASPGATHTIEFSETPGASGYHWSRWLMASAASENCETIDNITTVTSAAYSIINTNVKQQGSSSFHLVNSTGDEQSLELNTLYYGKPSSSLTFQSQIRFATTTESFKVQVKEDANAATWQDVYSQSGTSTSGEAIFQTRNVDLSSMNGKAFRIRFLIDPGNLSHYTSTEDNFGWFIDAITFSNVDALSDQSTELLAGTTGDFIPNADVVLMAVAPRISNIKFPASYQILTVDNKLQVEQPADTVLIDGASTVDFGSSEVGVAVMKTITLRNIDSDALTGLAANAGGTHSSDFVVGALGATTLAPGATTTFTVTFTPSALGSRDATLQITSNETIEAPFDINLSGTGLTDDPFSYCFVGTPYQLRVGNAVTFDLNRLISVGETIKISGKLPSGLKFNSATGLLSGTLSGKPGTYQFTVQALQGKTVLRTTAFPITVLEFPTSLIGNFDCILEDSNSMPSGAFRVTIKSPNQWSATLESKGSPKARKAKGTFALGEGSPLAPITAVFAADTGAPAVTINISIDGSTANQTGTYGGGTLRGFRVARAIDNPSTTVACGLILDSGIQDGDTVPAGLGWMEGTVGNKGTGSFRGLLGDGTDVSASLKISAAGQAVLWLQPYTNKNSFIGGIVSLGDLDQPLPIDPPLDDNVWWLKVADAKTLSYPNGFPLMPITIGTSRWIVPASATALGASLGWNNNRETTVTMDGGGLSNEEPQATIAALPTEFTIDDKYGLITSAPDATPLVAWKGSVSKTDGSITGTLTIPTGFSPDIPAGAATVSGLLLQDESWGTVTGSGLVKVPTNGVKGSFKTAAFILEQ